MRIRRVYAFVIIIHSTNLTCGPKEKNQARLFIFTAKKVVCVSDCVRVVVVFVVWCCGVFARHEEKSSPHALSAPCPRALHFLSTTSLSHPRLFLALLRGHIPCLPVSVSLCVSVCWCWCMYECVRVTVLVCVHRWCVYVCVLLHPHSHPLNPPTLASTLFTSLRPPPQPVPVCCVHGALFSAQLLCPSHQQWYASVVALR